ncbi:structural protein [Synechococcus phage syn9]|uniref:Structural protein n=1 Tax=Synechococcus phage syn9 TaxID=382359 RepID=Q0QZC0_BPSYS|nr:structural protein [Synechococcus phage syn9]ABA47077.1 structural protein [Synechococcus phage syn9]AGH56564.1 hypothetical protein CPUG_00072 [Cyanophage Syn10]
MANRIQLRRGGAQEWANANPTLAQGELGIELDTGRIKIGDGVTAWNSLRYERPIESTSNTANTLVQRDADGNFAAGTITATLIGNASTAARLSSTRQIQLSTDVTASGVFDGSANLNLNAELSLVQTLPHYDGTTAPSATYTKLTVDAKGRIINAANPTTIQDYGLDTSIEGTGAQPYDADLASLAGLTTTGIIARNAPNNIVTRTITGTPSRIAINDGGGINGNPTIDLIVTAVQAGDYNTESLTSVSAVGGNSEPFGTETVNATKFTVDAYGRLTNAVNVPIATATEGSKYPNYDAGTAYVRYDIIQNASKVYQALTSINAGAGAPTHSSGDTGSWRYLAAEATEQKGLASFAQEDFDVDSNGHVTIAALGVDNTQLQNNRIIYTDGNTIQEFELDNELTTSTAHTGFDYLNYIKINDTSGNLLFGANNTGDSGAGEIDVNVRSYFSDPDITLDGAVAQTLDKTGDGNLTFQLTQNSADARNLSILSTNAGSGTSTVTITAEDVVDIDASDANGKVHVENARFQANYIATTDATMNLDPGDDRAVTGTVRVWGDLQVDGTTTTVNSTTLQVDDPIITLGGDTAPTTDDNLDRGIEFRYYDTEARLGFYGWDTGYTDLGGHEGGYRFLHAATNTAEVFTGTDSGIIAGNVKLTTNTNSTSNTTGDLVVAGGAGIGQDVNIGGLLDVDGTLRVTSTSRFDDSIVLQGASKTLQLNNGSGTTRIELQSTTGNASFYGVVDITNDLNINTNKFNVASATGNTLIAGTLGITGDTTVTGATDLNSTLNVSGFTYLENTAEPQIALNSGNGEWEIQSSDYGAFRFDGGGYVEGETLFNSDIYVNGQVVQQENVSEVYNRQNYLQVRYKLRTGTSAAYNPSFATDNNSNLRVFGGAGIYQDLHIGDDLYIGKLNSGDTTEFSVLGESGNTTIGRSGAGTSSVGTLTVYGDTLLDRNLTVNGSAITLGNASSDVLTVNADATFNDDVTINGDNLMFTIEAQNGTDAFTVDSDNGNTVIAGTLNVDDATTITNTLNVTNGVDFDQTLNVDGAVDFNSTLVVDGQTTIYDSLILQSDNEVFNINTSSGATRFSVDFDNGNTNIVGTLTVGNATQLNNTLGVTGISSFTNAADQTLTGLYGADGAVRLTGGMGVAKNLAVGGNMRVYGDFEITGSTTQSGNTGFSGRVSITNTSDITSYTDNTVSLSTEGGFRAEKNAYIGGDFYIWDAANSRAAFSVDNSTGNAELHNNLIIGGNLTVNGTTTTVNSTVTTLDDPIITLGGDTAPVSNDGKDRGVEFRYYDGSAKTGFFGFDRGSQQYAFLTDTSNSSEVISGTDAALRAGSLNLTGTGTTLDVDANANIDGTLTVDGQIISQVSSGPALVIPTTNKINNLNADLLDSMTTASAATPTTVVNRDSNGDFAANQITVNNGIGALAGIQGNATTADALRTARTITIDGVVDGSVSFDGSANVTISTVYNDADITALAAMAGTGFVSRTAANTYAQRTLQVTASSGITLTNADGVSGNPTINVASASTNAANNLVIRDASGNFAANVITADLVGDVTGQVSSIANHSTTNLTEGTNLYYTTARANADFDTKLAAATTTDLTEGTNLYYTNARADARIVAAGLSAGTLTGNVTGNVTGNADTATAVSVSQSGSVGDFFVGIVANAAASGTSALRADSGMKFNTGTNILTVLGGVAANVTGNVTGNLTGNVTGDVTGNLTGNVTGDVTGNVDGNVSGEVTLEGTAPTTATDPGTAGDIRYDADYVYVCVATDTWKRSALATW